MYFLTDPLAGLEELMILIVVGVIAGVVLLIYIVYKIFNPAPGNVTQSDKDDKQKPGRTWLEWMMIGLVVFLLVASIIATCLSKK